MEYERIEKPQTGIISPSKLRMKLLGPRKKDGSNSNSSRTSPSRIEDPEFVNSLLSSNDDNLDYEVTSPSLEVLSSKPFRDAVLDQRLKETVPVENGDTGRVKMQHFHKADPGSSSTIHPVRTTEDENLDYDSQASSSSFEFDKGERPVSNHVSRSLLRPIPSKWNDAEKWIMNRHHIQTRKNNIHSQANRLPTSMARVVPESGNFDHKLPTSKVAETKRVDYCQPTSHSHMAFEKFSFVPSDAHSVSGQAHGNPPVVESFPQSKDLKEVNEVDLSCTTSIDDQTAFPGIRSVAMRDMGTEMTPLPSQEPSQTTTPVGSATPIRSPISSMPSTPRRGAPAPTPLGYTTDEDPQFRNENSRKQLSEEEMKIKTRREIAALGMQLGKMNIAAWASKDDEESKKSAGRDTDTKEQERIEFEKRAALWEEAEKSKHTARLKREEIKIQAWESQQKAKLEAEMRRTEAKVEQMRAQTHAKMVKKIAMARQRSEEKRAQAEARKNREAERTAAQAEYIRQTGKMPYSNYITCCGWL